MKTLLAVGILWIAWIAATICLSPAARAEDGKQVRAVPLSERNLGKNPRAGATQLDGFEPDAKNAHNPKIGALFCAGEVQLNFYALGGTGHGEHDETETHTKTETISETHSEPVINGPRLATHEVTTTHDVTTKHKTHKNNAPIQGGFGGAGAEAKVFVTRNIGLGLEGDWLAAENSIGAVMGTVTARFPMGSNAPYVFGGAGVQFGDQTKAVGKLGGGIEHRFSPHTGVFVDAGWMFTDHENAAIFRGGITLIL